MTLPNDGSSADIGGSRDWVFLAQHHPHRLAPPFEIFKSCPRAAYGRDLSLERLLGSPSTPARPASQHTVFGRATFSTEKARNNGTFPAPSKRTVASSKKHEESERSTLWLSRTLEHRHLSIATQDTPVSTRSHTHTKRTLWRRNHHSQDAAHRPAGALSSSRPEPRPPRSGPPATFKRSRTENVSSLDTLCGKIKSPDEASLHKSRLSLDAA